jgi:hypothetical protein
MKWLSLPAALLVLALCSTANADLLDRLTRVFDNEASHGEASYGDASYARATPTWARGEYAEQYSASDATDGSYFNYSGFHNGHGHAHAFGGGHGCDGGCTTGCGRGCGHAKPMFGCGKPSFSLKKPCGFGGCQGECGSAHCRQPRANCFRPAPKCGEPACGSCGKKMNFQWLYGRNCNTGCGDAGCGSSDCGCGKSKCHGNLLGNLFGGLHRGCGCRAGFGGCSSCGDAGGDGHHHSHHYGTPAEAMPMNEAQPQEPPLLPMPPSVNEPEAPSAKSASRWLMPSGFDVLPVGLDW